MTFKENLPVTKKLLSDLGVPSLDRIGEGRASAVDALTAIVTAVNTLEQQIEGNSPERQAALGV